MTLVLRKSYPYRAGLVRSHFYSQRYSAGHEHHPGEASGTGFPHFSIENRDDAVLFHTRVPVDATGGLDISAHPGSLVIAGRHDFERTFERDGYHYQQRGTGGFRRQFPLPEHAGWRQATAVHEEGVLTVSVPLHPGPVTHRIEIKAAGGAAARVDINAEDSARRRESPLV